MATSFGSNRGHIGGGGTSRPDERQANTGQGIGWNVSDGRPAQVEDWEQIRRSVAMLTPGDWAMRREQALVVLGALVECERRGHITGQ